jgi:hypothetical protein
VAFHSGGRVVKVLNLNWLGHQYLKDPVVYYVRVFFLRDVGQAFINASFNQPGKNGEMLLRCHPAVTLVGHLRPTVLNLARVGAD